MSVGCVSHPALHGNGASGRSVTVLQDNVASLLPSLSAADVNTFVGKWLEAYGSYFGDTFDPKVAQPQPFTWVVRTSLISILQGDVLCSHPWMHGARTCHGELIVKYREFNVTLCTRT